jgi:HEAT repeat protein
MSRLLARAAAVAAAILAAAMVVGISCARDGDAQMTARAERVVPDDTAAVARLLNVVRNVDPVLCELATRTVDMQGHWSRWGPLADDPLHTDSAAAALLDWIRTKHNDPVVVPRLRTGMRDADACVRRISASFLGRVEHPAATEALLAAIDDPSAETRHVAVLGLGMSERAVGIDQLTRRLRDDSPTVRRAAAWALGSMEASGALMSLIEALGRDPDPRVRQAAAWAIGRLNE